MRISDQRSLEGKAKTRDLDEDIKVLNASRHRYRHSMFWNRLDMCFSSMGSDPETDETIEDIFLFEKSPSAKSLLHFIRQSLVEKEYFEAGYQFWNGLLSDHAVTLLCFAARMLRGFMMSHKPGSLSFRMDALYGLDWLVPLFPQVVSTWSAADIQAASPSIVMMWQTLVDSLCDIIRIPSDLPLEKMSDEQRDYYQRERNVAIEVLSYFIRSGNQLGLTTRLAAGVLEFVSGSPQLYSIDSLSEFVLVLIQSQLSEPALLEKVLPEIISQLETLLPLMTTPEKRRTGGPSSPNRNVENTGDRGSATETAYRYLAANSEMRLQEHSCECDAADAALVLDLLQCLQAFPTSLLETAADRIDLLLRNLLATPASPRIRGLSAEILLSFRGSSAIQHVWTSASMGPRSSACSLDPPLCSAVFNALTFAAADTGSVAADILTTSLADRFPDAIDHQSLLLKTISDVLFRFDVGACPPAIVRCLPALLTACLEAPSPVANSVLDTVTDYIKRGGALLGPHSSLITSALVRIVADQSRTIAVYTLGLWLGKVVEANLCSPPEVDTIIERCVGTGTMLVARVESENTPQFLSLAIYALVRAWKYGRHRLPSVCANLPGIIYSHLPLMAALEGDVVAYSTNEYALEIMDTLPRTNEIQVLARNFRAAVLRTPGLIGESTANFLQSSLPSEE